MTRCAGPTARHPCDYCGTMLDEDDCVESDIPAVNGPTLHSVTQCREYVAAALRGYMRDAARFRQALADAAEALWLAGQGAPLASAKLAAELAHKVLPESGGYQEAAGCPYCGRRPDAAEPLETILQSQNRAGGPTFDKSSRGSPR